MKLCIKCSLPMNSNATVCNECGTDQVGTVECKQCQTLVTPVNGQCPQCATQIVKKQSNNPLRALSQEPGCCVRTVVNKND